VSIVPDDGRGAERFAVEANAQTHFAWLRTRLSGERTLMSFNRTAIALIGFGFTIYQFLAKLNVRASHHRHT
jgi:putative membrane protein